MADALLGRAPLVDALWRSLGEGHTVLVHGPVGIGKTALVAALATRARRASRPCGHAPKTEALGDVTQALADAYPDTEGATQRQLRGRLRLAVERKPGLLLLDHVTAAGTATKGFLKSLRGMGLGVLIAGDVEHPRDHARLREFGLAYREIEVPPLTARHLVQILERLWVGRAPLHADDAAALVRAAQGRPGWLVTAAECLAERRYWSADRRVHLTLLAAEVAIATAQRLFTAPRGVR